MEIEKFEHKKSSSIELLFLCLKIESRFKKNPDCCLEFKKGLKFIF